MFIWSSKRHRSRSDGGRLSDRQSSSAMKSTFTTLSWKLFKISRQWKKIWNIHSKKSRRAWSVILTAKMIFLCWKIWTRTTIIQHQDKKQWTSMFADWLCKHLAASTLCHSSWRIKVLKCSRSCLPCSKKLTMRVDWNHGTTTLARFRLKLLLMPLKKSMVEQSLRNEQRSFSPTARSTTKWWRWRIAEIGLVWLDTAIAGFQISWFIPRHLMVAMYPSKRRWLIFNLPDMHRQPLIYHSSFIPAPRRSFGFSITMIWSKLITQVLVNSSRISGRTLNIFSHSLLLRWEQ